MFCKTTRNRIDDDPLTWSFCLICSCFLTSSFSMLFSGMEDKTAAPLPSAVDDGEAGNVFSYEKAGGYCMDL